MELLACFSLFDPVTLQQDGDAILDEEHVDNLAGMDPDWFTTVHVNRSAIHTQNFFSAEPYI